MVKEKWVEVNVFCIMSNHIHLTSLPARQVWQIQEATKEMLLKEIF
jgi:REP element-mobilizing transposase RayT